MEINIFSSIELIELFVNQNKEENPYIHDRSLQLDGIANWLTFGDFSISILIELFESSQHLLEMVIKNEQ